MTTLNDSSDSSNSYSDVYSSFEKMVGVKSSMAEDHLVTLHQSIINGLYRPRLEQEEFWNIQDNIYAQESRGEITLDEMFTKLKSLGLLRSATRDFDDAKNTLKEYSYRARIESSIKNPNDLEAINNLMSITESIDYSELTQAPFANYIENNDQVWKYVDPEVVQNFLLNKTFIDDRTLGNIDSTSAVSTTTIENLMASDGMDFQVPTRIIVSAAGFGSWLGRNSADGSLGKGEKAIALPGFLSTERKTLSLHAIKAYASYPTELPPVSQISVYIQPNGLAYAGNESGDSHRIGAAILRGQATVKAINLRTVLLKDNVIETRRN